MARFCTLFSGSSGNCTYIGSGEGGILIDAGQNAKQIMIALNAINVEIESIKAIFVTHEHTDHISGARVLASRKNIPRNLRKNKADPRCRRRSPFSRLGIFEDVRAFLCKRNNVHI